MSLGHLWERGGGGGGVSANVMAIRRMGMMRLTENCKDEPDDLEGEGEHCRPAACAGTWETLREGMLGRMKRGRGGTL